jgi:predicted ABC-type ATPase
LNSRSQLWLVAGPNGAGKTTLVRFGPLAEMLPRVRFFNPDDLTLELLRSQGMKDFTEANAYVLNRTFIQAAEKTFADTESLLRQGEAVCVETVLSTRKYRPLVEAVRAAGGSVFLIYVALRSPELARARVRDRVRLGGHDVPSEKIRERWRRSLEQLPWFAEQANRFWVFDNSDSNLEPPPLLLAEGADGICSLLRPDSPEILSALESLRR